MEVFGAAVKSATQIPGETRHMQNSKFPLLHLETVAEQMEQSRTDKIISQLRFP